jgi:cellobiose-specific phosphotransferase system component IIC
MDDNTDLPTGIPEGYALAVKELQFAIQLASNNFIVALREDNPLKAPPVLILTQELGNAIWLVLFGIVQRVKPENRENAINELREIIMQRVDLTLSIMTMMEATGILDKLKAEQEQETEDKIVMKGPDTIQ